MDGKRLREARKARNLSTSDVGESLGVSGVTVSRWETEVHEPDDATKKKLAEALDVSVAYLMGETEDHGTADISDRMTSEMHDHPKIQYKTIETGENSEVKMIFEISQNGRKIRLEFKKDDPVDIIDLMMDKAIEAIEGIGTDKESALKTASGGDTK